MISVAAMVKRLDGLLGTNDLTEWETEFVENVVERQEQGLSLSSEQVEIVERIWRKHFAG